MTETATRQDLIDAFDYARPVGSREATEADLKDFADAAYNWYRKGVLELSQWQRDDIVQCILNPDK